MSKAKKVLAAANIEQFAFGFGVDDTCALNEWLRVGLMHSAGMVAQAAPVLSVVAVAGEQSMQEAA